MFATRAYGVRLLMAYMYAYSLRYNDLSADSIVELAQTFNTAKLAKIE